MLSISAAPVRLLTSAFLVWKALLLLIAVCAPGPGYDTSSTFLRLAASAPPSHSSPTPTSTPPLLTKLVRWDAVYFTQVSQRGHRFEQEWAFGVGLSTTLRWSAQRLFFTRSPELYQIAITGILLSHLMHYLSTFLVFYIASLLITKPADATSALPRSPRPSPTTSIPVVSAILYIISPAGIILSAPYTEALFAFRNLLGFLIYLVAKRSFPQSLPLACLLTILSGLIIGTATAVRSNGILSGIPFFLDFLSTLHALASQARTTRRTFPSSHSLAQLASLVIAGLLIFTGFLLPQLRGYNIFCTSTLAKQQPLRPWCHNTIPSIFTFVQHNYWNVGPFNYWKLDNIPLFTLAAPAITLLTYSSIQAIIASFNHTLPSPHPVSGPSILRNLDPEGCLMLALPQLILALLALFTYHVQIITRIASGYAWWYIWLAAWICHTVQPADEGAIAKDEGKNKILAVKHEWVVRWMILYAMIHAALYASFLPPA